jgi:hypothetical protein
MPVYKMLIDCDAPPDLQPEEEMVVENLLSALIISALTSHGCSTLYTDSVKQQSLTI